MNASTFEKVIGDFEIAAGLIAEFAPLFGPIGFPIAAGAAIAYKLLPALQAGVKAHEAVTGKPLDISLLKPFEMVPLVPPQV